MVKGRLLTIILLPIIGVLMALIYFSSVKDPIIQKPISSGSLLEESIKVMRLIKNNDLKRLSVYVHSEKGLRISPWPFISEKDQVFSSSQLVSLQTSPTVYQWGSSPAGEIELTYSEYYQKYIYDHDFINPERILLNQEISTGATINNIHQFYPKASFVLFHFDGFNPEYEGMDWASLYLIFINENDRWYLVGIAHDNWTP